MIITTLVLFRVQLLQLLCSISLRSNRWPEPGPYLVHCSTLPPNHQCFSVVVSEPGPYWYTAVVMLRVQPLLVLLCFATISLQSTRWAEQGPYCSGLPSNRQCFFAGLFPEPGLFLIHCSGLVALLCRHLFAINQMAATTLVHCLPSINIDLLKRLVFTWNRVQYRCKLICKRPSGCF